MDDTALDGLGQHSSAGHGQHQKSPSSALAVVCGQWHQALQLDCPIRFRVSRLAKRQRTAGFLTSSLHVALLRYGHLRFRRCHSGAPTARQYANHCTLPKLERGSQHGHDSNRLSLFHFGVLWLP